MSGGAEQGSIKRPWLWAASQIMTPTPAATAMPTISRCRAQQNAHSLLPDVEVQLLEQFAQVMLLEVDQSALVN